MPAATPPLNSSRSVAVLRALTGIGDMLCAVPALRSLRAGMPRARITLIGLPWASAFVERFGAYVDELVPFPGFPGIPEVPVDPAALPPFLELMQSRRFDVALQMQGSGSFSNPFTMLLGARRTAGLYLPGHFRPSEDFIPYPADVHELQRLTALTSALGMPDTGTALEWPVTAEDEADLRGAAHGSLAERYAIVHPGASRPSRAWPPERFAAVANRIADAGLQVVVTGTRADAPVASALASAMGGRAVDFTGRTSLGAFGALVRDARLVLCNDTGISHVAAAMRVPSVVVFSASDPRRWAPLDRELHVAVHHPIPAYGCGGDLDAGERCLRDGCFSVQRAACGDGLGPVEFERVLDAVETQLGREDERVA